MSFQLICFFFFHDTATTDIYTLSLHDALPISTLQRTDLGTYSVEAFCRLTGYDLVLTTGVREPECTALRRQWEIGRASCRERAYIPVVAGSLNKKQRQTDCVHCH